MEKKFNSIKYKNDYNREHYARLSIQVPLEDRPTIDHYWKSKGYKSFNAYVNDLIRRDMNNDDKSNVNIENIDNEGGTIHIG
ncbi:MAG: hypothetical protein NC548_55060 [Lachnospiraceae bacterium]|nr:hypothetical protein [Acetatifactor muris]MCM1223603.1 hypothetical protein [Lachnospiraceae bacterium]MCM1558761.1 hypothetical protein [Butyrivibrio sp.]